jgi:hypothetical protein
MTPSAAHSRSMSRALLKIAIGHATLSVSCASARPVGAVLIVPPVEPLLAPSARPAHSAPAPWSVPRAIPDSGLAKAPKCERHSDCQSYVSECMQEASCVNGRCMGDFAYGQSCNASGASAIDASVCRNGACVEPSERPRVCAEEAALGWLTFWRRPDYVYAYGCSASPCFDSEREEFENLPQHIGEFVVRCMAGRDSFGSWSVTWDPKAPYATPFPAQPPPAKKAAHVDHRRP